MTNSNMLLPTFIIGGAAASGTSFLTSAIIQHPEIYLPSPIVPECHYFYKSWEFQRGLEYYSRTWFAKTSGELALGERSSSYLFGGDLIAGRIAEALSDVKFIFALRNPIERAWANYRFTALQGLDELGFMDALISESKRVSEAIGQWAEIQPHNYTGRGLYAAQLRGFLKHFPMENILLIKSEDMSKNKVGTFQTVFRFVGVRDDFLPVIPENFTSVEVVSAQEQARIRHHLGPRIIPLIDAIRAGSDGMDVVRSEEERRLRHDLKCNLCSQKTDMDDDARRLLRNFFKQDLKELGGILPFDISDWN